ncbi:MAG: hypothetical protein KKD44_27300 [Proteobacteria bacterium]|nr:hypothetical protein [Pseudomonadota bacterium]
MMKLAVTGTIETSANLRAGAKAVATEMRDKMRMAGFHMEGSLKRNRFSKYGPESLAVGVKLPGQTRARGLAGHARSSIHSVVTQQKDMAKAVIGSPVFYVGVHETGKTIHVKDANYLRFKARSGRWVMKKTVVLPRRAMFERELAAQQARLQRILGEIPKVVVRTANGS